MIGKIMSTTSAGLYHDIFSDIVKCDVALNKKEVKSEKDLVIAAAEGDYTKIEHLLKSGVCVDAEEYNKLLYYACKKYLTPLQVATLKGHDKCVQLLIDHGADVNAKDLFGVTALHLAACSGSYNILKILLRSKADCSTFSYCVSLKYSGSTGFCTIPHLSGTTPLHLAAATNNIECVKELIRYGADFNAVDEHGRTSLYIAAQLGYSECVLIHLKEALGRDILSLPSFKTSDTPLHFAVKYRMFDCVKELLYLGSDVNHRNFDGLSPLHVALLPPANSNVSEQLEILKLLVLEAYKVDINQPDWEGYTPLHYVCFYGHRNMWSRRPELAKFLISYGANVNIKDYRKCSLLEQELIKYPEENYDILKYIVKSLLYLPRLKSLNITPQTETQTSNQIQLLSMGNLQERPTYRDWIHLQRINARRLDPAEYLPPTPDRGDVATDGRLPVPSYELPRPILVQPVLDAMQVPNSHAFVMDALIDLYGALNDINLIENQNVTEQEAKEASALLLKKQLWYEKIASSPRTLQHHCRFLIRKVLGPTKLKYIEKLPIPPILQSYLLFELDK